MKLLCLLLAASSILTFAADALPSPASDGLKFTLAEAEAFAIKNHPQILSAQLSAEAVRQEIRVARSGFFPQIYAESDSVGAPEGTRLAALDNLNNPTVFSRQSDGVMASQLIFDFGRTFDQTQEARFQASAAADRASAARAAVVLDVDRAYFDVRRSLAVLDVSRDTVKVRQFSSDQIGVLVKNQLKSRLDASFARVDLEQAQLLLIQAQNDLQAAEARLSTAMGFSGIMHFSLAPEPLDLSDPGDPDQLLMEALNQRPELAALRDDERAAKSRASAERAAQYPKVSAMGYAGVSPVYDDTDIKHNYYAGGINVEVPLATGGRLDAQAREAKFADQAAGQNVVDMQDMLARDVRVVLLGIDTARQKMDVTKDMVASSDDALQLAQERYKTGTSSIVELTQAELNDTTAKFQAISSIYDYEIGRSLLKFTVGSDR